VIQTDGLAPLNGTCKAFIVGCSGKALDAEERAFIVDERPFGLILFGRNCRDPSQVADLAASFREVTGRPDAPVMIDQEGGRVRRLKPPHWPDFAPAAKIGEIAAADAGAGRRAAWLHGRLLAVELRALGIDMDCAPVLDVRAPGMSDAIGDRSFGDDATIVAALGLALAAGLTAGGVVPVMKHMPGHGRGRSDSHVSLPVVDADLETLTATDFAAFAAAADGIAAGMTGHLVFNAVDGDNPATVSRRVVSDIIRGRIGFNGLLMTDDISMNALSGDHRTRAVEAFHAGVDLVLHCNGVMEEMRGIAAAAPVLADDAAARADRALAVRSHVEPFDNASGRSEYEALLGRVDWQGEPQKADAT